MSEVNVTESQELAELGFWDGSVTKGAYPQA